MAENHVDDVPNETVSADFVLAEMGFSSDLLRWRDSRSASSTEIKYRYNRKFGTCYTTTYLFSAVEFDGAPRTVAAPRKAARAIEPSMIAKL